MTIKSLLALIDDKLEDVFKTKKPDPTKARAAVLKGIERTEKQWAATEPAKGVKWFKVANEVVAFTPTLGGGRVLMINKKETNFVPSERFGDFLAAFRTAVEAGEFDSEIAAGGVGSAKVRAAKAPDGDKPPRAGWTPERKARFAASIAERNAAKAAAKK